MARHTTQNGQKCCENHSPFKRAAPKGYNFPCSIITHTARPGGHRRVSIPFGAVEQGPLGECLPGALLLDYVPPEEPPGTTLGNALRIR